MIFYGFVTIGPCIYVDVSQSFRRIEGKFYVGVIPAISVFVSLHSCGSACRCNTDNFINKVSVNVLIK